MELEESGRADKVGSGEAVGFNVNVPLYSEDGLGDADYMQVGLTNLGKKGRWLSAISRRHASPLHSFMLSIQQAVIGFDSLTHVSTYASGHDVNRGAAHWRISA